MAVKYSTSCLSSFDLSAAKLDIMLRAALRLAHARPFTWGATSDGSPPDVGDSTLRLCKVLG
eukprot:scaffold30602_cov22-Prasinocladus_malaysianus.AAC.1